MSKRREERFSVSEEQRWQRQERDLHALRDRVAVPSNEEPTYVDDAAIFDALSQFSGPPLPEDFVAAVTAASEDLQRRRRQVRRFRRAAFGGFALTCVVMSCAGLSMLGGAAFKMMALTVQRGLQEAPWLFAALVIAVLLSTLGGTRLREPWPAGTE